MDLSSLPPQAESLFRTVKIQLPAGYILSPTYFQAGIMVFLVFLLVLTLGQIRRRMIDWHFKGFFPGIIMGFLLAFFIEGLFVAAGSTVFIQLMGWKNPPKPISNALDAGRLKLTRVLGTEDTNLPPIDKILEY